MAEYYPLLARAVASMHKAPAEQRKAIYDRARGALLGQLRSMQPPVPEESITRESTALDEAIARLEGEIAVAASTDEGSREPPRALPPEPEPAPLAPAPAAPSRPTTLPEPQPAPPAPTPTPAPAAPSRPTTPAEPVPVLEAPARAVIRSEMTMAAPPPRGAARPAADALSRIVAERSSNAPVIRATRDEEDLARNAPPLPSAPRLQVPTFSDALADAVRSAPASPAEPEPPDTVEQAVPREDVLRPAAPRPITRESFNPRVLILAAVALAVVAGIGYAAWRLRDRPEALARSRAAMLAAKQAEPEPAKLVKRADKAPETATPTSPAGGAAQPLPASQPATSTEAPAGAASSPPMAAAEAGAPAGETAKPQGSEAPTQQPTAPAPSGEAVRTDAAPGGSASGGTAPLPGVPVAQRAAFLVDAPDDPQKIRTYVGVVVWSTDNATPAQNTPVARVVRAEIDVPDAGMKMSLVFQKNLEAQFPASHTLELRFTPGASSPVGGIKQIDVPQMRKDDSQTGDPLIGLPATITDNYFLVGLTRGDATQRNLDLIQTRNWFDVPLLLNSGKIAKVTFEKGSTGQTAINDVVASWQ